MLLFSWGCYGQDVHFSQTENAPLNLNPALCGFENDLSISSNYKTQWKPTLAPFKTFALSADGCLNSNLRSVMKLNTGVLISRDQAGDPQLNTTSINGYLASKIKITENQYVGAGIYLGYRQISLQEEGGQWASQYNGTEFDTDIVSGEIMGQMKFGGLNSGVGLTYSVGSNPKSKLEGSEKNLTAGVSIFNLNKPRNSFFENSSARLYQRYSVFVKSKLGIRGSIASFEPSAYYHLQVPFQEIQFGTYVSFDLLNAGRYIGNMSDYKVGIGLFHRWKDAFIVKMYVNISSFKMGLSYDFNVSSLQLSSNVRGGTEFFLAYQLKSFKK
ncbi:MAG: type IX secretion system PorP/SprF family membrane protein [Arenicella sp.]|jgi:type IX secretion system PorP/SprF family membrane protein